MNVMFDLKPYLEANWLHFNLPQILEGLHIPELSKAIIHKRGRSSICIVRLNIDIVTIPFLFLLLGGLISTVYSERQNRILE